MTNLENKVPYVKTYFRIETGYIWGKGHPEDKSKSFVEEISEILSALGFTMEAPTMSGSSHTAVRGLEELYCHPMNISGCLKEESISEIESALKKATFIRLRDIDTYENYYDLSKEETLSVLRKEYKEEARHILLKKCRTTRKTNFVYLNVFNYNSPIKTLDDNVGNGAYFQFLTETTKELVNEGLLVRMDEDKLYFRTLNKTELQKWSKKHKKELSQAILNLFKKPSFETAESFLT